MNQELGDKFHPNHDKPQQVALEKTMGKKPGGVEEQDEVTEPQHRYLEDKTAGDNSCMEKASI